MDFLEGYDLIGSLSGFIPFVKYMTIALLMLGFYIFIYLLATPYDEVNLIKKNNISAAISFGGAIIGYTIPLIAAMSVSVNLIDFAVWGLIAASVQISLFYLISIVFPLMVKRISTGEIAMGVTVASMSVVVGMINAMAMIP